MNMFKKDKQISPNDLVAHIEEHAKVLPFPREILANEKKRKTNYMRRRVLAFCVDLYAILVVKIMMTLAYTSFFKSFFFQLPQYKQKQMLEGIQVLDLGTTPVIFFTYFVVSYFSGEGKTLGKLMFKLTVVNPALKNDYFPNLKQSFMRAIGYCACYLSLGTLFFLPFIRKDRKSLSDLFSNTSVLADQELYEALQAGEIGESNVVTLDLAPTSEDQYKPNKAA
ncbi:MAG: RDD family protein [Bacteriovoracaceae bacterium]